MNLDAFLHRIGLVRLPETDDARLRELHRAMSMTVPYENLEVLEGRRILLDVDALFAKIVGRRRGGYCYELNGLFAFVLEELGYAVERRLARVWGNGHPAPPLTHMVLRVAAKGTDYLCDVGYGNGTLRAPVPWLPGQESQQGPDTFRLVPTDNGETMLQMFHDGAWKDLYGILPCPVRPQDFIPANHYSSTHPDSFFTHAPVAALNTVEGRLTLRGRTLKISDAAGLRERDIESFDELVRVLAGSFGIEDLQLDVLAPRLSALFSADS